jgi:hypothetical protein
MRRETCAKPSLPPDLAAAWPARVLVYAASVQGVASA